MSLSRTLLDLSRRHMAALPPRDRTDFEDELDRLRMMRVVEDGLREGDLLPDFSLKDGAGRTRTSSDLLDRGPLVLALFRGDWCPYCELTMAALEEARPAIEALGSQAVGVMPNDPEPIARMAEQRGIRYLLLADPEHSLARMCGLTYELSPGHRRIHRERGRRFDRLPVPAVFVADSSARVAYAFADVDPARWPDPEALLDCLRELRDVHALSKR